MRFLFSEKKKNVLIMVSALVVLVIVAGAFLFWPEKPYEGPPVFEKHVDDFVIEGNVITNEKEGLKMTIPDGWTAEKEEQIESYMWGVRVLSPDIEFEFDDPFFDIHILNKGCLLSVRIDNGEGDVWYVNDILSNVGDNPKLSTLDSGEDISIFKIDGHLALKWGSENKVTTNIKMPLQDSNLLYLEFNSSENNIDFCYEGFNKFLEGIEIKE